jgi:hypothetical protein
MIDQNDIRFLLLKQVSLCSSHIIGAEAGPPSASPLYTLTISGLSISAQTSRGSEETLEANTSPMYLAAKADLVKLSDEDTEWLYPGQSVDAVLARVRSLGPRIAS